MIKVRFSPGSPHKLGDAGPPLSWCDVDLLKVGVGAVFAGVALLGLILLNNAFGWGSSLSHHVPRQWMVGASCRLSLTEAEADRTSPRLLKFDCGKGSQGCAVSDQGCTGEDAVSAHLAYIKWDKSRLLIEAEVSKVRREIHARVAPLRVLVSHSTVVDRIISTGTILQDPLRTAELWFANHLLAILLGLGLLALFDGALLRPADLAKRRHGQHPGQVDGCRSRLADGGIEMR